MILAVSSHPVQYRAPLYRYLTQRSGIPVHALYLSDQHVRDSFDPGFGVTYRWAIDLLEGYGASFVMRGEGIDRLSWQRAFIKTYRAVRTVASGLPQISAIMLHGYTTAEGLAGLWAARALGVPSLLMEETELTRRRSTLKRALRSLIFPHFLRLYDGFLFIGSRNRRLYERYGIDSDRLFWTPYSVDNDGFLAALPTNLARREATRRELGVEPSQCTVLFSGKLIPRKRPLDLLVAVSLLPENIRPFLLFVGTGELDDALRARALELGVHKVQIVGFKNADEIGRYYACADVFVLPSEYDTWGLVVNEAMVHSLPVIVSEGCGCSEDLVSNRGTGFTFPVGDVRTLSMRLASLIRDSQLRHDMGARAASFIKTWSYAAVATGIRQALTQVSRGPEFRGSGSQ